MVQRRVTVASTVGLHARPATLVAKTAAEQAVPLLIAKDGGTPVAAGSVLNVMTLGAECGDDVIITAEGEHAREAVDAVADLVAAGGD